MNNEWHKNIPPQGVLCRDDDGFIVLITEAVGIFGFNSLKYGYPLSKLTPLTAEEWLNFAPWQEMDTAPLLEHILALRKADFDNKDVVTMTMLHCDSQRNGYKKWLPLPKEG